jgi:hypothetical protein
MDGGLQAGRAGAQYHHVMDLGGVHRKDSFFMSAFADIDVGNIIGMIAVKSSRVAHCLVWPGASSMWARW